MLAETEGFEPSVPNYQYDGLANRWFQPLTHVSVPMAAGGRIARRYGGCNPYSSRCETNNTTRTALVLTRVIARSLCLLQVSVLYLLITFHPFLGGFPCDSPDPSKSSVPTDDDVLDPFDASCTCQRADRDY